MHAACVSRARRIAGACIRRQGQGWDRSGINWKHCGAVHRHVPATRAADGGRATAPGLLPATGPHRRRFVDKPAPQGEFHRPSRVPAGVLRPAFGPFDGPETAGNGFLPIKFVSRASRSPSRHISARIGSANRQTRHFRLKMHALTRILRKTRPLFRARSPRKVLNREEFSFFLTLGIGSLPATMSAMPDGKTNQRTTTLRPLFQGTSLGFGPGPEDAARIGRTS